MWCTREKVFRDVPGNFKKVHRFLKWNINRFAWHGWNKKKLVRCLHPSLVHFHDIARLAAENQAQLFDGIGSNAPVFPQRVKRARGKVVIPDKLVLGNILFL